jgi:hypothetical protein
MDKYVAIQTVSSLTLRAVHYLFYVVIWRKRLITSVASKQYVITLGKWPLDFSFGWCVNHNGVSLMIRVRDREGYHPWRWLVLGRRILGLNHLMIEIYYRPWLGRENIIDCCGGRVLCYYLILLVHEMPNSIQLFHLHELLNTILLVLGCSCKMSTTHKHHLAYFAVDWRHLTRRWKAVWTLEYLELELVMTRA